MNRVNAVLMSKCCREQERLFHKRGSRSVTVALQDYVCGRKKNAKKLYSFLTKSNSVKAKAQEFGDLN